MDFARLTRKRRGKLLRVNRLSTTEALQKHDDEHLISGDVESGVEMERMEGIMYTVCTLAFVCF